MVKESLFKCPVCSKALIKGKRQYFCQKGHSFDIAGKGYVNLLLPNHKGSGDPGDSKEMLQSRREFLNGGYYEEFSNRLNDILVNAISLLDRRRKINILDAGCGEGYYTWRLRNRLSAFENSDEISIYGLDVSKPAIHYASGRDKSISFAVASTYHIPVLASCMDFVVCLFAPRDEQEFSRILKPSGRLIVAAPGPHHLYSLRTELYENPDFIGQKGTAGKGFKLLDNENVAYTINLKKNTDILNLLMMTPYSRHTDQEAVENLKGLNSLSTEIDINIMVYQKYRR